MKSSLLLFFGLFLSFHSTAQLGISAGANIINAPEWEQVVQEKYNSSSLNGFSTSLYFGLDYWFRLKNKRIEFTPELAFSQFRMSNTFQNNTSTNTEIDQLQYYSLFLNTNFYIFDFAGDCNCPTFSKDGDVFKKGLFIRLAPGFNFLNSSIEHSEKPAATSNRVSDGTFLFSVRAGVGIDIGVSDFFTITPLVMGTYSLPYNWLGIGDPKESFVGTPELMGTEDNALQIFAGIRLGFRFDELNKYGYR